MNRWKSVALVAVAASLFQAGWLLGQVLPPAAWADEPDPFAFGTPEVERPLRLKCRLFAVADLALAEWDLPGATSQPGQWVRDNADGWDLHDTDFEIGQKVTGYQQGWLKVCLRMR